MKYWLLKSEPDVFSIDDLYDCKDHTEPWDGIRNYQARNFMRDEMVINDQCFFYHSGKRKEIVGVAKVIKSFEPDPTDASNRFGMVTVVAMHSMTPVPLTWVKAQLNLQTMKLVKQPRLSVQPFSERE